MEPININQTKKPEVDSKPENASTVAFKENKPKLFNIAKDEVETAGTIASIEAETAGTIASISSETAGTIASAAPSAAPSSSGGGFSTTA